MGVKPCPVVTHGVRQKNFGGESRNSDSFCFEKLPALEQRGVDGHGRERKTGTVTGVPAGTLMLPTTSSNGTLVTVPIFRAMSGRFALLFELFGLIAVSYTHLRAHETGR